MRNVINDILLTLEVYVLIDCILTGM